MVVILEELSANDVSQHGRKLSPNYMKHLLVVTNGGQVRIRNTMLCFHPLQPRILCVNDQPDDWLKAIEHCKDTDGLPLRKRLLFLHVDELVVSDAAIEAHDADLDAMVAEGKKRRLELGYGASREVASASTSTAPPSEDTPSEGSQSGATPVDDFEQDLEAALEAEADCDLEEPMDCEELAAPQPPKCPRTSGDSSGGPGAAAGAVAASVEAAPVCATKRLAAFVHACGADGAKKLHGEGVRLAPFAGTEEFERHPDWQSHQRLEVNTRLDGASRDLVFTARADTDVVKLQKALLTRTLLNKRGARAVVEEAYRADVGRSFYDGAVEEDAFSQSLQGVQLDDACSGMRRVQWTAEAKKQGKPGKQAQRKVCAALWARLRREDAFDVALARLADGVALGAVLAETLAVHSSFLRMLVARDLAVLLPDLVTQTNVDACTVVGGGAEATLAECAEGPTDGAADSKGKWQYSPACRKTFPARLKVLHERLLQLLDARLLALVVPQGWTLDLTENACCELRRWDKARTHRKRDLAGSSQRQQQRLQEVGATWRQLGFAMPPALAH